MMRRWWWSDISFCSDSVSPARISFSLKLDARLRAHSHSSKGSMRRREGGSNKRTTRGERERERVLCIGSNALFSQQVVVVVVEYLCLQRFREASVLHVQPHLTSKKQTHTVSAQASWSHGGYDDVAPRTSARRRGREGEKEKRD